MRNLANTNTVARVVLDHGFATNDGCDVRTEPKPRAMPLLLLTAQFFRNVRTEPTYSFDVFRPSSVVISCSYVI